MRIIIGCAVVLGLITFYFIGWRVNKKQKTPKDFNEVVSGCDTCGNSGCGVHPKQRGDEDE